MDKEKLKKYALLTLYYIGMFFLGLGKALYWTMWGVLKATAFVFELCLWFLGGFLVASMFTDGD